MTEKVLVILNPNAGGGRAGRLWHQLEPLMIELFGDLVVAITQHPEQVVTHLDQAQAAGLTRVIAIGGDGTNHAVMNALVRLQQQNPGGVPMTFGQLPMGTGQDFARMLKIPRQPEEAVRWLASATPQPLDVGCVEYDDHRSYFLNIASAGIAGEVDRQVNQITKRRPWTFWVSTVRGFLTYQPPQVQVKIDGDLWYKGKSWGVMVANGGYFGRGMAIAPHAKLDDGLFDVVLINNASRFKVLQAFNTVYSGKHLARKEVLFRQARLVEIEAEASVPLDLDGEYGEGKHLRFTMLPGALNILAGKNEK